MGLKTLTSIGLSNCGIAAKGIAEVTKFISVSNSIASLSLKGNLPCGRISKDNDGRAPWLPGKELEGWTSLCAALATSKTITHLDVSDCLLDSEPVALLADAIKLMASLTKVVITGAHIGQDDVAALRAAAPPGCEFVWPSLIHA